MTRRPDDPPMVVHDFPLRPDLTVRLVLPRALSVADAERITTFVYSLAFDERPASEVWCCSKCGSDRWVATSLTGPISHGGRAIRQCVPCGHYSHDPVRPV